MLGAPRAPSPCPRIGGCRDCIRLGPAACIVRMNRDCSGGECDRREKGRHEEESPIQTRLQQHFEQDPPAGTTRFSGDCEPSHPKGVFGLVFAEC